ncbi:DUF4181 domain-containing protein [Cohnella lupini]|uniref:Uncharacterized protein DUF4181 n=1 Tax=Cohnella lupini TaxID=1294267 RepID=A0A3D9HVQ4_9BACL|nr:DUF4181 domain-containing protein [Cohnella lupini]RED52986.1 uncharacterized protein DUF4181 [Cohnella lupini]
MAFSLLLIFLVLINMILKKYIVPGESQSISDTNGKNINRWVKGFLALIAICIYFFALKTTDYNATKWFWLIVFLVAIGFQAFMEWKYLKDSKEYIISLILLALGLIYICIFIF